MKEYEFTGSWGLSKTCWLVNRYERERYGKMTRRWKKENPQATLLQEMLIEELISLHIYSQRLKDRRWLFSGEKTDYEKVSDHAVDIHSEDIDKKMREFDKYMPLIQKWKTDLLKLALANDIHVELGAGDVTTLFSAWDKLNGGNSDKEN